MLNNEPAYLASFSPIDRSPTARMMRLLDEATDSLMQEENKITKALMRERANALAECVSIIQCATVEDVKQAVMIRYEERHGID